MARAFALSFLTYEPGDRAQEIFNHEDLNLIPPSSEVVVTVRMRHKPKKENAALEGLDVPDHNPT